MIPHKLILKNFLSYGEELSTIDFKEYGLICLSGKNGHGKSALLDAITWALWGQARKVAGNTKADEGLLRLGQSRMMVSLEFSFNDRIYRVRREFAKSYGKPQASLDFELFDDQANKFISLTDKTIKATSEKIETLLGVDFETFINSAFIRQGQSNEFSRKSPKERKQILTTILGFSKYDELQQLALEKTRLCNEQKKVLELVQEQSKQELLKKTIVLEEQKKLDEQRVDLEKQNTVLLTKKENQEKELTKFITYVQLYENAKQELIKLDTMYGQSISSLILMKQKWQNAHRELLQLPSKDALEKERVTLFEQELQFRTQQSELLTLQQEVFVKKEQHQKELLACKEQLEKERYIQFVAVEQKRNELTKVLETSQRIVGQKKQFETRLCGLKEQIGTIDILLETHQEFEKMYDAIKLQFEKRRTYYQVLVQRGNWARTEISEHKERKKKLLETEAASCPLCEQMVTIKRKQFLIESLDKELHFFEYRVTRVAECIKKLKQLLIEQHEVLQKIDKESHERKAALIQKEHFCKEQMLVEQELARIISEETSIATQVRILEQELVVIKVQAELFEKNYQVCIMAQPKLMEYEQEIKALEVKQGLIAYDRLNHERTSKRLTFVQEQIAKIARVDILTTELQESRLKVSWYCSELKRFKIDRKKLTEVIEEYQKSYIQYEELGKELTLIKEALQKTAEQGNAILTSYAVIKEQMTRFEVLSKEEKERDEKIKQLDQEAAEYSFLGQAFGKNGIQALLIEEIIPEIEFEANKLLAKLTDNQAQIFIESLKDLKKGGVKETLDIQISDAAGIRPYEMFSGGEAFRIDFSLRIAISKLLARRAGTALQTLIIDEGFGSQDEEALSRMMDAIFAIQEDFARIIIVSHLAEMKDNFPIHFVVEKLAAGSVVTVEERG